jgi:hypothetical protein
MASSLLLVNSHVVWNNTPHLLRDGPIDPTARLVEVPLLL